MQEDMQEVKPMPLQPFLVAARQAVAAKLMSMPVLESVAMRVFLEVQK